MDFKGKFDTQHKHNCDVKCFTSQGLWHNVLQCPNKRILIIRENRDMDSKSDRSNCKDMPPLEDYTGEELHTRLKVRPWL
jgi:hypothetical protein